MESRAAVKVGVMVVVGMGLLLAAWVFLAHLDLNHYRLYAQFDDTKGLQKQTPVRMNGVAVGEVKDIQLGSDLKPVVTLAINNAYKVPADSKIRITSGLLITNPQIEIIPPKTRSGRMLAAGDYFTVVEKEPAGALA